MMPEGYQNGAKRHQKHIKKTSKNRCRKRMENDRKKNMKEGGTETSKIVLPPRRRASSAKSAGPGKSLPKHHKQMPKYL